MKKLLSFKSVIIFILILLAGSCSETENRGLNQNVNDEIMYDMPVDGNGVKLKEDKQQTIYIDDPVDNTEGYDKIVENVFISTKDEATSTFSIDVDNASYSNIRRFLDYGELPPPDAVRIEEMINYFDYTYPEPHGEHPFSIITEISDAPWNTEHRLIHIGIQGKRIDNADLKPSNLVFLIDASGSMEDANKLPLLKKSLGLLLDELSDKDRVSIVVYAGAAGVVLESTPATEKKAIKKALDKLSAGGSTAGGQGIELAYDICQKNLIQDGNNRIILATDGDFNVGMSSNEEMVDLITEYRQKYDIYLTICGFGMGNYKDDKMEQISNAGNGNYFYIDSEKEAEKVFVKDIRANMFTIAKDVKIQVEFNPDYVLEYRLIGYENRVLNNEDFDDDKKDAGELGAGHTVTAIYEVITTNSSLVTDLMNLKLRYKPIKSETSILLEQKVKSSDYIPLQNTSNNFRFSAAVASFGMLLRGSSYINKFTYDDAIKLTKDSYNKNDEYQVEFLSLLQTAKSLVK
ncbi:MAG: VWA domain-containing protein [Bacteroidales bacterium]|nr:VWA domain-containing protein [Bacteroidales bacterium]